MNYLRQSTASQEILLGPFVDSTDGDTEETALTIANTDIILWKHGATTTAAKNSGGATHISNGRYYATLDATDTNTLGMLEIHVHVTGALAVWRTYQVLAANVYDSLFAGSDNLQVDVTQVSGSAEDLPTATALATVDANVDSILADTGTDGVLLAATATSAQLVDDVWDETITTGQHNSANTAGRLQRLAADIVLTDSAVNDVSATTTTFNTDLTEVDNFWNDHLIVMTSGALTGQTKPILSYANTNGQIVVSEAFTSAPNNNVTFSIVSSHVHPVTQISTQVMTDLDGNGSTVIDAIKAKTDQLTFTVANEVDANTQSINDVTITGDGNGTPFDVV